MKNSITLENKIEILSEEIVAENTLIQRIKDLEEEKIRIVWIENRKGENVRCDYEIGPFKVIAKTEDNLTGTKTLYGSKYEIIEYNSMGLARYSAPLCPTIDYVDLVEVFDFSNHQSIAPYDGCEKLYKKLFQKEPEEKKYGRK